MFIRLRYRLCIDCYRMYVLCDIRYFPIYCNCVSMALYSSAPIKIYYSLLYSSVYMLEVFFCLHVGSLLLLGLYLGLAWLNVTQHVAE